MIAREWALEFAREWSDAWNAHDGSGRATHGFVQWSVQPHDPNTSERGHSRMPALQTRCSRAR